MAERLQRGGWVYVLHHGDDSGLALETKLGLNRLGHQIWVRERDAPDQNDWKAHSSGIERAGFVVMLETAALSNWKFAHELVELAEEWPVKAPEFIRVEVDRGCSMTSRGFVIPMRARPRRLVREIDVAMQRFREWARPAAAPTGHRGPYVLLSYASTDADKVAAIRERLAATGIFAWDYAVCPRQPAMGHEVEIPAAIKKAKAVLIVLTAAWSRSRYCRSEFEHARESGRRRVWLRFGPGTPPEDCGPRDLIDLRGRNGYARGFARLAKALGRSRPRR